MMCPRCFKSDVTEVNSVPVHYICNDPSCVDDNGARTQFSIETDSKIHFPCNQIFVNRNINEFYRKPYLTINPEGNKSL